jgi:hypothetical protein
VFDCFLESAVNTHADTLNLRFQEGLLGARKFVDETIKTKKIPCAGRIILLCARMEINGNFSGM